MNFKAAALSLFLISSFAYGGNGNRIASQSELDMMKLSNSYNCLLKINDAVSGELISSQVQIAGTNTGSVNGEPAPYSLVDVVESSQSALYVRFAISGTKKGKALMEVKRVAGVIEDSRTPMGYWATEIDSVNTIAEFSLKGTQDQVIEVDSYRMTVSCVKTKK